MSRIVEIPGWRGQLLGGFRTLEPMERRQFAALWDDLVEWGLTEEEAERHVCAAMIAVACVVLGSGHYLFDGGFNNPGFLACADLPIGTPPVEVVYLTIGEDDAHLADLARDAVGRRRR